MIKHTIPLPLPSSSPLLPLPSYSLIPPTIHKGWVSKKLFCKKNAYFLTHSLSLSSFYIFLIPPKIHKGWVPKICIAKNVFSFLTASLSLSLAHFFFNQPPPTLIKRITRPWQLCYLSEIWSVGASSFTFYFYGTHNHSDIHPRSPW